MEDTRGSCRRDLQPPLFLLSLTTNPGFTYEIVRLGFTID